MKHLFFPKWFRDSSFAGWQRYVALLLSLILVFNTGLFSVSAYADTFEVSLDDFREDSPEDLQEFGLVSVVVEGALMNDRTIASHVQGYCQRVQEVLGAVCLINPWKGETVSRIVEALQQMYFEGIEVQGGLAKLIGVVIVGEVPLPVVNNGIESFPSFFPYTDLVRPAYVYDAEQERFVRSSEEAPQAEIWHGLIRPPGEGEERLALLQRFFEKNAQFYAGEDEYALVKDKIGFHDHYWENDSFDNETKRWYLKKLESLDRLFNYRYSGEWLQELSGEAVERLTQLTSRTFDDAPVEVEGSDSDAVDAELGFDSAAVERESGRLAGEAVRDNQDTDAYGGGRLEETVPDPYSAGPIRNFLKDYVSVVSRYISGATELLDTAGRRQSHETLAALITKMDKFHSSVLYLISQEFEQYIYQQAEQMALDFELVHEYEVLNEFYTEEATDFLDDVKAQLAGDDSAAPLGVDSEPKEGPLQYGSKIYTRFVNGIEVAYIQDAEHCSLERGSNFITDDEELGKAVSMNRKGNPLTVQDIAGVKGENAKKEIKRIYKEFGYCSYNVKDRCVPAASKRPLFDFAASEFFAGDNDYRRCFNHDGPPTPDAIEESLFKNISSIINHVQPTGGVVQAMLEKKLAHYFPIDAVRHVSFYLGGGSQYSDASVGRIRYPNFFDMESTGGEAVFQELRQMITEKERDLRRMRVEANWKRFAQYIAYSLGVPGRPDFWNYNEIPGFEQTFAQYRESVMALLKSELDPVGLREDFELVEDYLLESVIDDELEQEIQGMLMSHFPNALVQQDLDLKCSYEYEVPPINFKITVPEIDKEDIFTPDILLEAIIVPDLSPPSVSRDCSNKIAKSTQDNVKSLRAFYFSLGGVKVNISILHDADGFIEVLNPAAVILYFTPVPPPLPPNLNMLAAIEVFNLQLEDLEEGSQPVTLLSKTVKPVPLLPENELQVLNDQYGQMLFDAVNWLNLSIEGKHKEGLSLLTKEKEMVYLVLDGDAEHIDFTFPQLRGSFDPDDDVGIAASSDILDEIRDRERKLQEEQREKRDQRALQSLTEGEKQSECGDSVPLIEWPGAVSCWLNEIISGPLIEPASGEEEGGEEEREDREERGERSGSGQGDGRTGEPGVIVLSQNVLTMRDRATATLNLPLEIEVTWEGDGAVRVVSARDGKATVIPERIGEGTVRAHFDDGSGQRFETARVRVSGRQAVLRQVTTGDVQIGTADELEFEVEIHDADGELIEIDATLEVFPEEEGVFALPSSVSISGGSGDFTIRAAKKAKMSGLSVGSDLIARSKIVYVNALAGEPAELRWDFGDKVMGLDALIEGKLTVHDRFGNPYRSQGMRFELEWDKGLIVNGKPSGSASFFVLAGKSPLKVEVDPEIIPDLEEARAFGYGYGYGEEGGEGFEGSEGGVDIPELGIRVVSVDGLPEIELPEAITFDLARDYRVQFVGLPDEVTVGQHIEFRVRVEGDEGILPLQHKIFTLESEFAGEVEFFDVPMQGAAGQQRISAGAYAGTLRLVIDDQDFGSITHEVEVLGQKVAGFHLEEAHYVNGELSFVVSGNDALRNKASLKDMLGKIRVVADGADVLEEQSLVIEEESWNFSMQMSRQPDRVQLELIVEGLEGTITKSLALQQLYTADDLKLLSWDTPYMILGGSAFGDYRVSDSVAQAMLFGDSSRLQSLTTELTPHSGWQQVMRIWPSGRVSVGPDMKVEAIWENLKPVLVFSDPEGEVGRLSINLRELDFQVQQSADASFQWNLRDGTAKAVLVPDQADYEAHTSRSGDLVSDRGKVLMSIDQLQVDLHDSEIETEIFDDSGDVLVLDFLRRGQSLARLYVHLDVDQITVEDIGPLQWRFTGQNSDDYVAQSFYAGESTADERGLVLLKKGEEIRYSVGRGRPALDDVRDNNGEGFGGRDKLALAFLAGNGVGESALLQSEGIVNLGDPVISLRQAKQQRDSGEVVPVLPPTALSARTDYSIGQLVYAPEEGEITHVLRLDVEGDGEDDLVVVLDKGGTSEVRYLEGQGEGYRWGDVSTLLDLGPNVKQVEVVQKSSLLVLYNSGQVAIEQNLEGHFVRQMMDFSVLEKETVVINDITVRDFDDDRRDDVLFLTGDRELWIWYGTQTLEGIQFGLEDDDRQLLRVMSVRLSDPEHLKTGAWLYTPHTPTYIPNCRESRFECQAKYFRGFAGVEEEEPEEEVDRLGLLIEQSENTGFQDQEDVIQEQQFLVRLDQLSSYRDAISIELLSHQEGAALNLKEKLDFEVTLSPRRSEDPFVMRYDLGADFRLVGRVECEGCTDELQLTKSPTSLWGLEGKMVSARPIIVRFTLEYKALPDFTFQVMHTNQDEFPDIGINVSDNTTGRITVFESRGPREYVETIFGEDKSASREGSPESPRGLADLMRGVGLEGKTQDQLKQMLLNQQSEIEASTSDLFNNLHEDNNADGYPDVYQENPSLVPDQGVSSGNSGLQSGASESGDDSGFLDLLSSHFLPKANAQAKNVETFNTFKSESFSNLDNVALMFDNIEADVQMVVKALKCSRGCLPLPINFAFLAPGPINIMGMPAGFDPGVPLFGLSPVPFFIWPPLVAYQVTQFRIYISPTLTMGLGIGICLGQYLLGQCFVFSVPIAELLGDESICDSVKSGLGSLMKGIQSTVGQVTQGLADAVNSTGVIKAEVPSNPTSDIESILGVSIGGGTHNRGVNPEEQKVFLNPVPDIFVNWWDRQWEEVVNSLTDLPDITVRLPDFSSSIDKDYFDKLSEKVSGETFLNLQQLYDLINSLPVISLHPDVIEIQVPWIEPGLLKKIEQSLYKFLHGFMLEFVAFLRSFNLPCNITIARQDLFSLIRERAERKGISEKAERCSQQAKESLEEKNVDVTQVQQSLDQCLGNAEISQETVAAQGQYFNELKLKHEEAETLNKKYEGIEKQIHDLQQPQKITDIFPVFLDVLSLTLSYWQEQAEGLNSASAAQGVKREAVVALRSCIAQGVALDMAADVTSFVEGIQKNLEALEKWKKFPRQLARYLNALEFYIEEVVELIDQITSIVLKWWGEFERKLDLWIDVIFAYQELIALVKMIIDILKDYNKSCGLCTSDRLTLKEIILKLIFGVVPEFPIIDFPSWPDVRLDFSDVQLGIDVTLPVFEVKTIDLKWPELPTITFPRLDDFGVGLNIDLSAGFSVKLPEIPLVIPEPPDLPPLQPLPDLPQINLPNLPPAPEVPMVLESLLPIMKIIQTILDIWCLINKSLIPIDEKQLKTQIENLTNRSLNLILPIDVMLTFDLLPGDLMPSLIPFDLISVTSQFQAGVDINPLPNVQETVDQQFHEPMNAFLSQVDAWLNQLRNTLQQGAGKATDSLQNTLGEFELGDINLEADVNVEAGVDAGGVNPDADVSGLINYEPLSRPSLYSDQIAQRKDDLMAYHKDFKRSLQDFQVSLGQFTDKDPESLLSELAALDADHVLVAGTETLLKQQLSQEKRKALLDPQHFVEKQIALIDKPALVRQITQTGNALKDIQQELLAPDELGIDHLGVAVVRDGEVGRLQDYPLEDPVISVWDNDIFLAYENSLYVKSSDNDLRQHDPYNGRVLRADLDRFQRSKVHQLTAESASSSQAGGGNATVRWSWEAPGVTDVELTIWDSVGGAQRLDQDHLRFYLHETESSLGAFEPITPGVVLSAAQPLIANREVRLRFGEDQLIIPRGVVFTIPSLVLRSIVLDGVGAVALENFSGERWDVDLGEEITMEVTGMASLSVPAGLKMTIPRLRQRPFVKHISDGAKGALVSRVEVVRGEKIPKGIFAARGTARLQDEETGAAFVLQQGVTFRVSPADDWVLVSGGGDVVVSDDLEFAEASVGMALMDEELVQGHFVVQDGDQEVEVLPEQQVIWADVDGPRFEVTLPVGNYYGRVRDREGQRGYSPIIHGAAQPIFATAQVVAGIERVPVPIYTSVSVDARDYVIGDLPDESHRWRLEDETPLETGRVYRHPGFSSIGERSLELFVRDGENDYVAKTFVLDVFIPELIIDEILFEEARVVRVETVPPVPNIPLGIVGERDDVQDWLLSLPVEGSRLEDRYYTNDRGIVQLQPLEALEGLNVIIDGGRNIARLYRNGRVVLHEEFREECQNEPIHDSDGYLKFRISCVIDGRLAKKFEARMVPHIDTDVSIVEAFTDFDTGVIIRSLQEAIEIIPLPRNVEFAAGGAQVRVPDGRVLMVIAPDGQVELVQENLSILQKPFEDPTDLVVWQLIQNQAVLAEFQIKGPGENIDIIDPVEREVLPGDEDEDGMLDRWEATYLVDDPTADPDTDGLTNLQEFQLGTHPQNIDTDGDGLTDGEEEDPLSASSVVKSVVFSDVSKESPYHEAIMSLARFGFIQGYGDGTFKPDQPVTRAEAIKILMSVIRCENCEFPSQETKDTFQPTLKDFDYFVEFHDGLFDQSSLDPLKNFAFEPDDVRSRDSVIRTYLDVAVSDWFYYCVEIATELGLIHGYRGFEEGVNALGNFIPSRNVNIAELMKMVIEAVGDTGKQSDRIYEPSDGWWNDSANNYLAKAEEDLQLLLEEDDYRDPLRKATRAEVAYAAFRVLRENGVLDFDKDGIANQSDQCPCQVGQSSPTGIAHGCPAAFGPRRPEGLFEGIEITQDCFCLVLVDADLFVGSRFFAVITGQDEERNKVFTKSNSVGPP